jgi:hypothetical protein
VRAMPNYDQFKAILPYASEIFGVYQPMIGWKSKRQLTRAASGLDDISIVSMMDIYDPDVDVAFIQDEIRLGHILTGRLRIGRPVPQNGSLLLMSIANDLEEIARPTSLGDWVPLFLDTTFEQRLRDDVFPQWREQVQAELQHARSAFQSMPHETPEQAQLRLQQRLTEVENAAKQQLEQESIIAKVLFDLFDSQDITTLDRIFYGGKHPLEPLNIERLRELVLKEA